MNVRPALLASVLALGAAGGCKSGPFSGTPASAPPPSASEPGPGPTFLRDTPQSGRDQLFFRVDALVSQWDAAQADGRDEQAAGLGRKIGEEVDRDLATFASASRGDLGLKTQSLAVKALAFSSDRSATALLVERLAERDPQLVGNALIALKVRADPDTSLPPVIALLRSRAIESRRFAPLALANVLLARERAGRPLETQHARDAMTGLVGLIQDPDPIVRLHAAKAMGALGQPEANDFLLLLLRDEHVRIRLAAAVALERIGDPRAFPQVIALLDGCDEAAKPLVRDVLVSYAERLQGAPLTDAQRTELGTSARAWDRWFAERQKTTTPAPVRPPG